MGGESIIATIVQTQYSSAQAQTCTTTRSGQNVRGYVPGLCLRAQLASMTRRGWQHEQALESHQAAAPPLLGVQKAFLLLFVGTIFVEQRAGLCALDKSENARLSKEQVVQTAALCSQQKDLNRKTYIRKWQAYFLSSVHGHRLAIVHPWISSCSGSCTSVS